MFSVYPAWFIVVISWKIRLEWMKTAGSGLPPFATVTRGGLLDIGSIGYATGPWSSWSWTNRFSRIGFRYFVVSESHGPSVRGPSKAWRNFFSSPWDLGMPHFLTHQKIRVFRVLEYRSIFGNQDASMSWLGVMIDNITGDNVFLYPMPRCSMVLEYLPTFTLKKTVM